MGHVHTEKCFLLVLECTSKKHAKDNSHVDSCYDEIKWCGQKTDYEIERDKNR